VHIAGEDSDDDDQPTGSQYEITSSNHARRDEPDVRQQNNKLRINIFLLGSKCYTK